MREGKYPLIDNRWVGCLLRLDDKHVLNVSARFTGQACVTVISHRWSKFGSDGRFLSQRSPCVTTAGMRPTSKGVSVSAVRIAASVETQMRASSSRVAAPHERGVIRGAFSLRGWRLATADGGQRVPFLRNILPASPGITPQSSLSRHDAPIPLRSFPSQPGFPEKGLRR